MDEFQTFYKSRNNELEMCEFYQSAAIREDVGDDDKIEERRSEEHKIMNSKILPDIPVMSLLS